MRALRLLHGDVPDVRAARRRARQPARPHLPDQGHARERPARDGRRRAAHRPLPELPLVHDDVPVGRALPASDRSRARARRADVSAAARGAVVARGACARCCRIRGASASRWPQPRLRDRSRACCRRRCVRCSSSRRAGARARRGPPTRPRALAPRRKRVALVTGCVQTVIAPEINAATIRLLERCGAEVVLGRRLLRRARASSRQGEAREYARCRARRTAACRARWRRPRRDRRECVRLRHARQGLRLRVSRRHRARVARSGRCRESARRDGGARRARLAAAS